MPSRVENGRTLRGAWVAAAALLLVAGASLFAAACASEPDAIDDSSSPTRACAACHAEAASEVRLSHLHVSREQGCFLCHKPHSGAGEGQGPAGLRASCEDCHAGEKAQFSLPFRHPLGAIVTCTSCHPPHGHTPRELREELHTESCTRCHLEFAGPYQFEHEGDRNRGCLSCHEPHGSPNRRLLTYADSRTLCLDCHGILPDTHLDNPGSIYRQCLTCHTEVHGSNWDRDLFR